MSTSKREAVYVISTPSTNSDPNTFIVSMVMAMNLSPSHSLNLTRWLMQLQRNNNFTTEEEFRRFMRSSLKHPPSAL